MPMNPRELAADIRAAFVQTGRDLPRDRALRLAREIAAYGGLEAAVAALAHDDAFGLLADALAFRAALAERAEPAALIARLLREALDMDARAEPAWAEAAEFHGRARFRAAQGERELAGQFQARALSAERLAAACEDQALAKRLQAARLKPGAGLRAVLFDLTALAA
jgi:hypothetical protein